MGQGKAKQQVQTPKTSNVQEHNIESSEDKMLKKVESIRATLNDIDFIYAREQIHEQLNQKDPKFIDLSRKGIIVDKHEKIEEAKVHFNVLCELPKFSETLIHLDLSFTCFLDKPGRIYPTFPTEICSCSNLTKLEMQQCYLLELPKDFGIKFPKLEYLDLSNNNISHLDDDFWKLKNLKVLNLNLNKLQKSLNGLQNLINLEEIDLSHNYVQTLPDLSSLKKLKKFHYHFNPYPDSELKSGIPKLPSSIEVLNLRNAKLSTIPKWFQPKNLPNLVKLDISFGNITSLPDSFAEFTKLEELLLSGHKLTSLPNNFSSKGLQHSLKTLSLRENKFKTIPPVVFELENLEVLDISINEIDELDENIEKLSKLQRLNISYNNLKKLPKTLGALKDLCIFKYHDNPLEYPDKEICSKGPDVTLEFLKKEGNYEIPAPPTIEENLSDEEYAKLLKDRIRGCIYGQAMGDAIGLATEFLNKRQSNYYYGVEPILPNLYVKDRHRLMFPTGDFTDDTDQMLCILDSIIANEGKIIPLDFAKRLYVWVFKGIPILADEGGAGLGRTVKQVIFHESFLEDPHKASEDIWLRLNKNAAANGSVMRTSVLGILDFDDLQKVMSNCTNMGRVTHHDPRCIAACLMISTSIALILQATKNKKKVNIDEVLEKACELSKEAFKDDKTHLDEFTKFVNFSSFEDLELDESSSIGYTFKAMGCGIVGLKMLSKLNLDAPVNVFEKILTLMTLEAGDADTNGAVCGAVCGAYLGFSKLPSHWINSLPHKKYLDKKIEDLFKLLKL